MENSATETTTLMVQVQGSGKTREQALASAFGGIQSKVKDAAGGVPLRIEPIAVTVLEAKEERYTEKFMFFFWKRECEEFFLKLNVEVRVFLVKLEDIPFTVVKSKNLFR